MAQNQIHKLKFLALGDSYTIGESVGESERWPVQLIEKLRNKAFDYDQPKIIAKTGWRTDELKNAILNDQSLTPPYDLVSLLIGVNNQYQGKSASSYRPEFEDLLKMAITLAGGRKKNVFVVSIPDYGFTPFGKGKQSNISPEIETFNEVNRKITNDYGVTYVDITPLTKQGLTQADLVATDGLHPSGKMYTQWVDLILPAILRH